MEKISYRSYIQMRFKLGISAKQVHSELKNFSYISIIQLQLYQYQPVKRYYEFREEAEATYYFLNQNSFQTVNNWSHLFKKVEKNLKDKRRPGRPITATPDKNISKIREFIKSDPYFTYGEIEAEIQIS